MLEDNSNLSYSLNFFVYDYIDLLNSYKPSFTSLN